MLKTGNNNTQKSSKKDTYKHTFPFPDFTLHDSGGSSNVRRFES